MGVTRRKYNKKNIEQKLERGSMVGVFELINLATRAILVMVKPPLPPQQRLAVLGHP